MRLLVATVVASCGVSGCFLDFDQFQNLPARDASADIDAPGLDVARDDVTPPPDGRPQQDVTRADRVDAGCAAPSETRVRVAHMAPGFGAVQLCMRRTSLQSWSAVASTDWPARGVSYAEVSQHVALNQRVTTTNEAWQFALVPLGTGCNTINVRAPALATWVAQLDPQKLFTLVFTTSYERDGTRVGVLGLLDDKTCTDCASLNIDVRAVHASVGASTQRINLAISYHVPLGVGPDVNQLFAMSVPYGGTATVGGLGYECDSAWWLGASLPVGYPIQLSAFMVGGDPIVRSERVSVKANLLRQSRMATVFFAGAEPGATPPPEFVLCYEGTVDAGMTQCDRIATMAVADAGVVDAAAPDAVTPDVPVSQQDAFVADDVVDATVPLDDAVDAAEPDAAAPADDAPADDAEPDAVAPADDAVTKLL